MVGTKDYPNFYILDSEKDKIFWTISEVSERLHLEAHVLRFWEKKFKKLKPTKKNAGNRYYKISDIRIIEKIRDLLYKQGYTIQGAERVLNKGFAAPPMPMEQKTNETTSEIADQVIEQEIKSKVDTQQAKTLIEEIKKSNENKEKLIELLNDIEYIEKLLN